MRITVLEDGIKNGWQVFLEIVNVCAKDGLNRHDA
jgi:hypothetical protein